MPTLSILPTHLAEVRLHQPLLRQQTPLLDHTAQIHQGHREAWESRTSANSVAGWGLDAFAHMGQIWRCQAGKRATAWRHEMSSCPYKGERMCSPSQWALMWWPGCHHHLWELFASLFGKKPTQNIFLGKKKTKKPTNIYVVEQSRLPAHLACKRLQAPNQLSTWVYNKVKPLKKIMSSRSKSKGGNGVWEGRKINFALSPEKGWEREFVHNMCVASIENRNEIQDQRQKLAFLLWPRVVCLRSVCYRRKPSGGRVGKGSKYQKYTGDAALTGGPWAALEILLKKTALSEDIISSALP